MDAARDGACRDIGRDHAQFSKPDERIDRLFAGGGGEQHVAVERGVHRIDRAGKSGLRDHRQPLGLRLGQVGVGDHHRQRGVLHGCRGRAALDAHRQHARRERWRRSASAIFAIDLKRRRPEPWPVADRDGADRIDHRDGRDLDAIRCRGRCRADPALEIRSGGAEPGADAAEREVRSGGGGCGITEVAVGRKAAPGLVAAVQEIETDRAGHDRNHRAAYRKAAALFGEPGLHPAAGLKPERRAAGERDGVDPLHGVGEIEQRAFACTGPAAAHVDRRHGGFVENHRGDAGRQRGVVGMTDADARDIGEEVFHRATHQAKMTARPCRGQPHRRAYVLRKRKRPGEPGR